LAGHLVERHHAGARTPRRDDHVAAVDQRRLADQPRNLTPAEIREDVALPDRRAACRSEAGEITVLGEHVEAIAVDGRRAARPGTAIVAAAAADGFRPLDAAVGAVEARDRAA